MRSSHSLDRLDVAFDDDHLVADAGLLLPATLAHHLGLRELVDEHLDLGDKPGRANAGDKLLTLVMSALAGGDCIDDANALRAGGAGPGAGPLTIDLDSTICETYGLKKEGALHHGYTGVRGYHPLLAIAAGTGGVVLGRPRGGGAPPARGGGPLLPPAP